MKRYLLIFAILSLFLIVSCENQQPIQPNEEVQAVPEADKVSEPEAIEMPVPEERVEDVAEKTVETADSVELDAVEIDMIAKRFEFVPSTITVKQGQSVKINVKSVDVAHGFTLPDYGISERLDPGKEVAIEFVAGKKGTFTFFCSVSCGSGHGAMKGKLIVE